MLATIFAYFWNFASFLHVSCRRLEDSDDQAGTHSSLSGQGSTQLPDRDSSVICTPNAQEQGHFSQPSADLCTPHTPRRSLLCVERGRARVLRNESVGIYYAIRTVACGLLCLLLAAIILHTIIKQDAKSNRERDDRVDVALGLYQGVMAYVVIGQGFIPFWG